MKRTFGDDGDWVGWVESPHPEEPTTKVTLYVWRRPGTWTADVAQAAKFNTKRAALAAVDDAGPRRLHSKKGATKVGDG